MNTAVPARPGVLATRAPLRSRAARMFERAMEHNIRTIARVAATCEVDGPVCDIGCWDGATFVRYAPRNRDWQGIERNAAAAAQALDRGIKTVVGDLEARWDVEDGSIALVTSNQVIEHVSDVDHFVRETFRVLRPGGLAVVSTENLASWHNVAALVLGWQPFSLTNISSKAPGLGNPAAILRHDEPLPDGWHHVHVVSARALRELFVAHGFVDVRVHGAGYYPLPSVLGGLDPTHAAFITVAGQRP